MMARRMAAVISGDGFCQGADLRTAMGAAESVHVDVRQCLMFDHRDTLRGESWGGGCNYIGE
jgi:hypothetical protein